nr:hypothetical protein [Linepithema humile rhabdo-like virus 1]
MFSYLEKLQVPKIIKRNNNSVKISRIIKPYLIGVAGVIGGHILTKLVDNIKNREMDRDQQVCTTAEKEVACNCKEKVCPHKDEQQPIFRDEPSYDIVPGNGFMPDVSDKLLSQVNETVEYVKQGKSIDESHRIRLEERVKSAALYELSTDPNIFEKDTDPVFEDIPFKDVEAGDIQGDADIDTEDLDESSLIHQVPPQHIDNPTIWIINALKQIHSDIQDMKPMIETIPIVKRRIDEVQSIMGQVTTEIIEMKNSIGNMEATITQNRIEIAKMGELIKTLTQEKPPIKVAPSIVKQVLETPRETNLVKLIDKIVENKKLGGSQVTLLKSALISKNSEVIKENLNSIGIIRPVLEAEVDLIVKMDILSTESMTTIYKLLNGLIKINVISAQEIKGRSIKRDVTAGESALKKLNPFSKRN